MLGPTHAWNEDIVYSYPSSMVTPCIMMELATLTFSLTHVEFPIVDLLIDVLSAIWHIAPTMLSEPIWGTHRKGTWKLENITKMPTDLIIPVLLYIPDIFQKWQPTGGLLAPQTASGPSRQNTEGRESRRLKTWDNSIILIILNWSTKAMSPKETILNKAAAYFTSCIYLHIRMVILLD